MNVKGRKPIDSGLHGRRPRTDAAPAQPALTQPDKLQHFVSEPGLTPPLITVNHNSARARRAGESCSPRCPRRSSTRGATNTVTIKPVGPGGPMILDERGRLVWFDQLDAPNVAANLRVQRYRGERVLTWWQGSVTPSAFGVGEGVIADHSYATLATVALRQRLPDGHPRVRADPRRRRAVHDLLADPRPPPGHARGPALAAARRDRPAGRRPHRPGRLGVALLRPHPALGVAATPENSASYDAFHINSIQPLAGGKVLVSPATRRRSTSSTAPPAGSSGGWAARAATSSSAKGAQLLLPARRPAPSAGRVSLFDDEAGPPQYAPSSRGLVLKLRTPSAQGDRRSQSYHRQADTSAQSEGSLQTLPDGGAFVGWGARAVLQPVLPARPAALRRQPARRRRLLPRLPLHVEGDAADAAQLAAVATGPSTVSLYASWNGATEVDRWRVLAGQPGRWRRSRRARRGFETRIDVAAGARLVQGPGARLRRTNSRPPRR